MKKKAIILVLGAIALLSACTKNLTKLNVDPKHPQSLPSYTFFTYGEHELSNSLASSNVNLNIFRLIEQQWQETTYTDESNYNLIERTIPDSVWGHLYGVVLTNLNQAKIEIPTDVADAGTQKNELAITDILEVYSYYYLLTTFGNVPYTQALNIAQPFPKYDDAKTIYTDLLSRLSADVTALNESNGSFGSADIIYAGDPNKWKTFAYTLQVKMGMTIADSDPTTAQSLVESAYKNVMASNSDNAMFNYISGDPNTNPIWVDLVESGRQDFVACSTVLTYLVSSDGTTSLDPRLPYFFTVNASGTYTGGDPGASCSFGQNSKPSGPLLVSSSIGKITNPDFPGDILDFSETQFSLAEAAERGWNVGKTAEKYYQIGVASSIAFWTGVNFDATVSDTSAWDPSIKKYLYTHEYTDINSIAQQKYLALYNRGWDAWIEQRRLDYPALVPPSTAQSGFPVRFTYPINEQDVNGANYTQAASAIGGDLVTTKLWFDTKGTY